MSKILLITDYVVTLKSAIVHDYLQREGIAKSQSNRQIVDQKNTDRDAR